MSNSLKVVSGGRIITLKAFSDSSSNPDLKKGGMSAVVAEEVTPSPAPAS
jgi:hypothetical protein